MENLRQGEGGDRKSHFLHDVIYERPLTGMILGPDYQ